MKTPWGLSSRLKHLFRSNSPGAFQSPSSHPAVSCAAPSPPSLLLALFRFLVHLDISVRSSSSPLPPLSFLSSTSSLLPLFYLLHLLFFLSSTSSLLPLLYLLPPLLFLSCTSYLPSSFQCRQGGSAKGRQLHAGAPATTRGLMSNNHLAIALRQAGSKSSTF